jgi:prefoldin subunit 5
MGDRVEKLLQQVKSLQGQAEALDHENIRLRTALEEILEIPSDYDEKNDAFQIAYNTLMEAIYWNIDKK